ncbi:MAG TPA: DUF5916 domain-containing protein [Chitinophagaceae bacterium]|nr:DUF5916 domain-containing protein [Chitinophagaceae bacterium]
MRRKGLAPLPLLLLCILCFSQPRSLPAVRTLYPPRIDGDLGDSCWQSAPLAKDFIQNFPVFGKPASQRTVVRILYDDDAIYVGAYLYDDPALIRRQLTARDGENRQDVDYFSVFFDTYDDQQNGFQFTVTSANVQSDARLGPNLSGDFGDYGDKTWDAVWSSSVGMRPDGWVVEMRIPYLSLRFARRDVQRWGLQLMRSTRRNNETTFWNPVDPHLNGFVNQFGKLTDLRDIRPPLRLSFSPYLTTGYQALPEAGGYTHTWLRNGGMDVKYGINESFTLDATLIPDYGQVVSDDIINNLSPFEVKFQENRPFFTEGTELFNKAGLFYSRRVGAVPPGYYPMKDSVASDASLRLLKNPSVTQLYNAIKFSGRTRSKLGIGLFNAVTAPMYARIRNQNTGEESRVQTSPLTDYNILVLDQALRGQSYLTFTNTHVARSGDNRQANVSALDLAWYDRRNLHALTAAARYSKIYGSQRYDGFNTQVKYGKVSGNWQYYLLNNIESDHYDPTDLGYLEAPNEVNYRGSLSYTQYTPTPRLIYYSYSFQPKLLYAFQPYAFSRLDLVGTATWVFHNFWDITLSTDVTPLPAHDFFELRTPGRYLAYPVNYILEASGSTDSRRKAFFSYDFIWAHAPKFDNTFYQSTLDLRYRFSPRLTLELSGIRSEEYNQLGYAFVRESDGEPIVGFRTNTSVTSVLSGIYHFTPRINLSLRARHYWDKVHYLGFYDVNTDGSLKDRPFIANHDQDVNIFNLDAFLTWDFRLGSRLILGWKNRLGDNQVVDGSRYASYVNNFRETLSLPHGNEATIKFIYFLDYNQLRRKHGSFQYNP